MRPLTEEETRSLFEKLSKFIGENVQLLIDRPDCVYCFRLHKNKVFYVSERNMKLACSVSKDEIIAFGTCLGKFTKSNIFKLHITALDYIAPYAKHKMWLKPSAEQQFLYGHNVLKSGLARVSESTIQHQGVVIYSMNDLPLGFGVAAKSAQDCRRCDPMTVVAYHQADIGEYIRCEDTLT